MFEKKFECEVSAYAGSSEFTYNPEQNNVRQSLAPIPNLNFMLSFGFFSV